MGPQVGRAGSSSLATGLPNLPLVPRSVLVLGSVEFSVCVPGEHLLCAGHCTYYVPAAVRCGAGSLVASPAVQFCGPSRPRHSARCTEATGRGQRCPAGGGQPRAGRGPSRPPSSLHARSPARARAAHARGAREIRRQRPMYRDVCRLNGHSCLQLLIRVRLTQSQPVVTDESPAAGALAAWHRQRPSLQPRHRPGGGAAPRA